MLSAVLATGSAHAQQALPPPAPAPGPAQTADRGTALKVQIVLSRFHGDKKIASLPYTLGIATGSKTSLRMGIEVPVATAVFGPGGAAASSYNYRNVGTNIDCSADAVGGPVYRLMITVSDSSIQLDAAKSQKEPVAPNAPAFRTFNSSFTVLLKDGETTQYTSATDPVSGEVMKIDVTLNVMR